MGLSDSLLCSGCFFKLGMDGDVNVEDDGGKVFDEKNGPLSFCVNRVLVAGGVSKDADTGDDGTEEGAAATGESENKTPGLVFLDWGAHVRSTSLVRPISSVGTAGMVPSRVILAGLDDPKVVPLVSDIARARVLVLGGSEGGGDGTGVERMTVGMLVKGSESSGPRLSLSKVLDSGEMG